MQIVELGNGVNVAYTGVQEIVELTALQNITSPLMKDGLLVLWSSAASPVWVHAAVSGLWW